MTCVLIGYISQGTTYPLYYLLPVAFRRGAWGGGRPPRGHRRRRRSRGARGRGDRLGWGHIKILYKALKDYTKPHKLYTAPKHYTKTENIRQNQNILDKHIKICNNGNIKY